MASHLTAELWQSDKSLWQWVQSVMGMSFVKMPLRVGLRSCSSTTGNESRWEYNRAGKELRVAAFAGWLLGDAGVYPLQVSGINPAADPLYDGVFSGRGAGTGWSSRNNLLDHGGLPLPEGAGVAEEALLSVRMDWQLPVGAPVNVYGGVALVDGLGVATVAEAMLTKRRGARRSRRCDERRWMLARGWMR